MSFELLSDEQEQQVVEQLRASRQRIDKELSKTIVGQKMLCSSCSSVCCWWTLLDHWCAGPGQDVARAQRRTHLSFEFPADSVHA